MTSKNQKAASTAAADHQAEDNRAALTVRPELRNTAIADYLIASEAGAAALAAMREALGPGEEISLSTLSGIKVPAGGATTWEFPDGGSGKDFTGIILDRSPVRAYWSSPFSGEGNPPDCASLNNYTGVPSDLGAAASGGYGGECRICPMNQWGSAKGADGNARRGKACRQITQLLVLPPRSALPVIVRVPPSSYIACQAYSLEAAGRGQRLQGVITLFSLAKAQSRDGITYARIVFATVCALEPAARDFIDTYARQWQGVLREIPLAREDYAIEKDGAD